MKRILVLVGIMACGLQAGLTIETAVTTGNVQIKREESRKWETLERGTVIEDNDILQTSYKSNCEIRLGRDNVLFMGSNSRILVSKVENEDKKITVSITLFSGSVYSKIIKQLSFVIYTSTALCRVDNGIFNCTVDEVSGITGFHVFKGDIIVSNISVQGEQPLKGGETSTLAPNTPPSAPRKISAKQMSVLTRFYGADFINQEIESTGLEVAATGSGSGSAEASTVTVAEAQKAPGQSQAPSPGEKAAKGFRLFNKTDAMRRLAEYDQEHYWMYQEPADAEALSEYRYRAGLLFSSKTFRGVSYPDVFVRPGVFFKNAGLVLNIPMVADSSGKPGLVTGGTRAILDKLYSVDARYKRTALHIGDIDDLTFGRGIVLRDYSNRAASDNVRNVGLQAVYRGYLYHVDFFTSGVSDFRLMGLQYRNEDTLGSFSVSMVRDNGEKRNLNNGDLAFRGGTSDPLPAVLPDSFGAPVSLTAAEIQISRNFFYVSPVKVAFYFTFAGLFMDDKMNLKGFDVTLPGLSVIWGKQGGLAELYLTRNHFTRGLFGPFYEDNLYQYQRDSSGAVTRGATLASRLPENNTSIGIRLGYKVNPLRKVTFSVEAEGLAVHFNRDTADTLNENPPLKASTGGKSDGSLDFRLRIGQGQIARVNRLEAYYTIRHIGYFAGGGYAPFTPNPFTASGVRARFMIRNNLEGCAGYENYYYDQNGDGKSTSNEKVSGFSVGLAMGF